jgi:hypothetical protein
MKRKVSTALKFYVERIREVTVDYRRGLSLLEKTIEARQQDLAAHQQQV